MLRVKTNPELRQRALEIAEPLMQLYRNNQRSILRGRGIYFAKLAELLVAEVMGWKHIDTFHADSEAILKSGSDRKMELKVKHRTVPPRGSYNASVACYNTKQECDYYVFCSTLNDEYVYLLGVIPKQEFLNRAILRREGELDPDGPAGQNWRFRADCYNMPYNQMRQIGKEVLSD